LTDSKSFSAALDEGVLLDPWSNVFASFFSLFFTMAMIKDFQFIVPGPITKLH